MNIIPVDDSGRLFQVENILPVDIVNQILQEPWTTFNWSRPTYESPLRRAIDNSSPVISKANNYIWEHLNKIGDLCRVKFKYPFPSTVWWYDEPGFTIGMHTDGELAASMQLFWIAPDIKYGTVFYNSKMPADIKHTFDFITNTGYIMLNLPGKDGAQPLQWHGMLNNVPDNCFRLTSYTIFGSYETK